MEEGKPDSTTETGAQQADRSAPSTAPDDTNSADPRLASTLEEADPRLRSTAEKAHVPGGVKK